MSSAGTNWNSPTRPRSQALPVMSYMCQASATISIWLAVTPESRASQKRMKDCWEKSRERWVLGMRRG